MSTPATAAWRKISPVRLLPALPRGDRVEHVLRGHVERVDGVPLAALELDDDALDMDVLARPVELDPVPGHDELVARNVRGLERLADGLRGRRARPGDGGPP